MRQKSDSSHQITRYQSNLEGLNVFISYSKKDKKWADSIEEALKKEGVDVWRDETSLRVGATFETIIVTEINAADYFIILLSRNSTASTWVKKEVNAVLARENNSTRRILIPIKLDDSSPPDTLQDRLYLDFNQNLAPIAIKQLLYHLEKLVLDDLDPGSPQGGFFHRN